MSEVYVNGVWPTPPQRLLLLTAVGNEAVAQTAWDEWANIVDLDTLDYASMPLLPLLYPRLDAWHISHPWLNRLRGIYRRTWYKNQLLLHHLAEVLARLHAVGLQTLVLNGPALVLQYYHDNGGRPIDDLDLLVPTSQAQAALDVLQVAGYQPRPSFGKPFRPGLLNAGHAIPLTDANSHNLDLHWHALADDLSQEADAAFWAGAVPVRLEDVTTLALNPADQLLRLIAQGVRWKPGAPIRWLADALVILQATPTFDWSRLLAQTEQRGLVLPVRTGLTYLADHLAAPIPPAVLDHLRVMPVTWADQLEYRVHTRPPSQTGPLVRLWLHYRRYCRTAPTTPVYSRPLGFTRFLRDTWGLDHTWQAPVRAVTQATTQLWKRTSR